MANKKAELFNILKFFSSIFKEKSTQKQDGSV